MGRYGLLRAIIPLLRLAYSIENLFHELMLKFSLMDTTTTALEKNPSSFLNRLTQAAINFWEAPYGAMFFAAFIYLGISLYSGRIFMRS